MAGVIESYGSSNGSFQHINLPSTGTAPVAGTGTLVGGTVTIATTAVTANSVILATYHTPAGATQGVKLTIPTRTAGVSFVVNATDNTGTLVATDTSTFDWVLFN